MFGWFKKATKPFKEPKLSVEEQFSCLWGELVPSGGEAETLQGEIVRAVGRLEDEYNRNGNVNWEPGGYHNEFVEFLKQRLADPTTFDAATVKEIWNAAERVRLAAEDLETEIFEGEEIRTQKHSADPAFPVLIKRAVEWCQKHPEPIYKKPGHDFWITLE
jgi:hypothetical protein